MSNLIYQELEWLDMDHMFSRRPVKGVIFDNDMWITVRPEMYTELTSLMEKTGIDLKIKYVIDKEKEEEIKNNNIDLSTYPHPGVMVVLENDLREAIRLKNSIETT